jgi:hypothetical protein
MIPLPLLGQMAGDEDRVNGTLLHDGQQVLLIFIWRGWVGLIILQMI